VREGSIFFCEAQKSAIRGNKIESDFTRYCVHCQDQQSGELASKEQVREGSINVAMKFMGKTREEAEKMADEMMPKLPRWRE